MRGKLLTLAFPILLGLGAASAAGSTIRFSDVTRASRIDFRYEVDGRRGKMISTMGGGLAAGDYDGDGWTDLFVVGTVEDGRRPKDGPCGTLYRNRRDGTFEDVTAKVRLRSCGWQMGAAFVDVDSDGRLDLVATGAAETHLFRNLEDGTFADVGEAWGFRTGNLFAIGLAAADVDGDGRVDLYPLGYLDTTIAREKTLPTLQIRIPEDYPPQGGMLFLQREPGKLVDATAGCGCANEGGKGTGAVFTDYDLDGRPDLFVANDRVTNRLFHNEGGGTFRDVTDESGAGAGEEKPRAGMGIAVGDPFRTGRPSFYVTNFGGEESQLLRNVDGMFFEDATKATGTGAPTWPFVQWGTQFADFDDDGAEDLYAVSGHLVSQFVRWLSKRFGPGSHEDMYAGSLAFEQPAVLFRNLGDGRFEDATPTSGDLGKLRLAARGSAAADFDGDGRLDLAIGVVDGRPRLLRNATRGGNALEILPVPGPDNRTPLGTKVRVTAGGGTTTKEFLVEPTYASGLSVPLHFGLGAATVAEKVEVIPPGKTEPSVTLTGVAGNRLYRLRDGRLEPVRDFRK